MILVALLFVLLSAQHHGAYSHAVFNYSDENPISGGRIIGGSTIAVEKYPWYIAIVQAPSLLKTLTSRSKSVRIGCGGTLISPYYGLSAAHCFQPSKNFPYQNNRAGLFGLQSLCPPKWSSFDVFAKVLNHKGYYAPDYLNDIALIVFSVPRVEIPWVCLPQPETRRTGLVTIVGYGSILGWPIQKKVEMKSPCKLQEATVIEFTHEDCSSSSTVQRKNQTGTVCAGIPEGGVAGCYGDSGGPLMYQQNSRTVLEGITSFGSMQCARPSDPTVYTHVPYFLDWIKSSIKKHSGRELESSTKCGVPKE